MRVSIELTGVYRDIAKADKIFMPITGATLVRDALEYVRNKYPAMPLEAGFLVSVNHEIAPPDRPLRPDDVISFFPHIGGG